MSHYDEKYFAWQKAMGEFGGKANLFKFKEYIKPDDKVIDFGCGGGFLLSKINCKEKMGIEINSHARENACRLGIKAVERPEDVPDEWADVIISDNALEHVPSPLETLRVLHRKLKKGGRIIFVIPNDRNIKYEPNDINQHLYTWSPMCAGNLFTAAGFTVSKVENLRHLWPPKAFLIRRLAGETLFNILCRVHCVLFGKWHQIRVLGHK